MRHPGAAGKQRIVGYAERRVWNAAEETGARGLHDRGLVEKPKLGPPRFAKHENRDVETNSAQNRDDQSHRAPRLNGFLKRLSAIALLAASFGLAGFVIAKQPEVEHLLRTLGPFAGLLAVLVFAIVASAPFSVTDALAIMNGAIFGPVEGAIVNAIGLVLAALLGYAINRHASHMLDVEAYLEKLPRWVKRFPVGSPLFLISVRVIPGFGGTMATATAAAFRVPVWVHVWTMCAIAVPICTLLAIFGDRVTVFVHQAEHRAHVYYMLHRPHFRFHRHTPRPLPTVTVTP